MTPNELRIDIPNLCVAVRHWSTNEGIPTLALHGWLENAASFDTIAPLLSSIDLFAIDLPGHGLSAHRSLDAGYDFVAWMPDILNFVDKMGWTQYDIIGHSLGGAIATFIAAIDKKRVRRIVLLDAIGPLASAVDRFPKALQSAIEARRGKGIRSTIYRTLDELIERLIQANPALTQEAAMVLTTRGVKQGDEGYQWRYDPRLKLRSLQPLTEAQVQSMLRHIACNCLLVRPHDGWPIDTQHFRQRTQSISKLRIVRCEGSHHVHLVNPTNISDPVIQFLKD